MFIKVELSIDEYTIIDSEYPGNEDHYEITSIGYRRLEELSKIVNCDIEVFIDGNSHATYYKD